MSHYWPFDHPTYQLSVSLSYQSSTYNHITLFSNNTAVFLRRYDLKLYGYPYEIMRSIAGDFEENGQLVPKYRGGVCCPILQGVHNQWLV
jgi:hypothetical protein